jgi:hypothetical protein
MQGQSQELTGIKGKVLLQCWAKNGSEEASGLHAMVS